MIDVGRVTSEPENASRCELSAPRTSACGGPVEILISPKQKLTELSSISSCCRKEQGIHRMHPREGLTKFQSMSVTAEVRNSSNVQPGLNRGWQHERRQRPSNRDNELPHVLEHGTPTTPHAVTAAAHKPCSKRGTSVDVMSCFFQGGSALVEGSLELAQPQPHNGFESDSNSIAYGEQAEEARKPTIRLLSRSAHVGRLKHRKNRSPSLAAGHCSNDNDLPSAESSGRNTFKVAALASAARSCMQRRVSVGTRNTPGIPLLTSQKSRSFHHVFFEVSSHRGRPFPTPPTENGRATEASENGKSASSRTSSNGTFTETCAPYDGSECRCTGFSFPEDIPLADLDTTQKITTRVPALAEGTAMVSSSLHIDNQDRRLLHRVDPAKLLRISCSKCFSDDQTRQARFADVKRPVVCEDRFSSRYFRRKGEACGAPGTWAAHDAGAAIISRKIACMLVREVQREVRYGFYPICTRAAVMWILLITSILLLLTGAWLTVEDQRHIECRLNYEDETLQEGGSRYSLLSITADLCSGPLRTFRLKTSRPDEKSTTSGKGVLRQSSSTDEQKASWEPRNSSNSRRGRRNSIDTSSLSLRRKVSRRGVIGYSVPSSTPPSYFFPLPPPPPQSLPQTKEDGSVISQLSGPYIYVYIEMERFYQSDAQVVWSRKDEQLAGKVFTDPKELRECEPAVTAVVDNVTKVLHPCGVLAWNIFTDRFQFLDGVPDDSVDAGPVRHLIVEQSHDVLLSSFGDWRKIFKNPPADVRARHRDRVYFWMSVTDNEDGKDMYKTREEAKAELLMDRLSYIEAGDMVENGHFIQWMHTAPFGTWRKLYGRIPGPVKLPLFAYIAVTYDVKQWRGKKAIVLVQPSRFSGHTQFLGGAYLTLGIILFAVSCYMIWRKCIYVTEEDDVECTRDLRWRTQRKRRGKKR